MTRTLTAAIFLLLVQIPTGHTGSEGTAVGPGSVESGPSGEAAGCAGSPLAGTNWRLVHFQSMDDAIGTIRPEDPSLFTMNLSADCRVTMQLDCNRAIGTWAAKASGDSSSGQFSFGPLAATRALCPPPNLDELIVRQAEYIRGYLLREGKLYLSLMADGGIFAWEPENDRQSAARVPLAVEDGGTRNWKVTGVSASLNLREQPSTRARIIAGYAPGTKSATWGVSGQGAGSGAMSSSWAGAPAGT
jgi:heat shock protein HslJ